LYGFCVIFVIFVCNYTWQLIIFGLTTAFMHLMIGHAHEP